MLYCLDRFNAGSCYRSSFSELLSIALSYPDEWCISIVDSSLLPLKMVARSAEYFFGSEEFSFTEDDNFYDNVNSLSCIVHSFYRGVQQLSLAL